MPVDGFVAVEKVVNLLRQRGYKYRGLSKKQRSNLWTHPETRHAINLPNRDLMPVAQARQFLLFAGMTNEEIDRFIAATRS